MSQPDQPTGPEAVLTRINLLMEARRPADARRLAEDELRRRPGDAELLAALGWTHLDEGDATTARTWIRRSLAADPERAWTHDLDAYAILEGAGKPAEARAAARRAVQADPFHAGYLFTLVRACLAAKDREGAIDAAGAIRRVDPVSHLGPMAEALVALDRGTVREFVVVALLIAFFPLLIVAAVTRGVGLLPMAVVWLVLVVRRAPHLRRADALIHEALQLRPDEAWIRTMAADVLRDRFRFAQSVDHEVAVAAIDAGLVDARELASSVAGRTTALLIGSLVLWVALITAVDAAVTPDPPVAAVGIALTACIASAVWGFERWQTRSLPRPLVDLVHRSGPLPLAAVGAALFFSTVETSLFIVDATDPSRGYHLAALGSAPLAWLGATVLLVRWRTATRSR